jgi:nitrous oxidase accessory protein
MKTVVLKRTLAIGLAILLVGAFVVPNVASATTIYVDDDNTTGPWDGTLEHPYQFIGDGIDSASSGDTVYVFNGTYYERFVIDKTINLVGEDRDNTVIDGNTSGNIIIVNADGVSITGFTIQNSGWLRDGIRLHSNYNTFSNNNISNNCYGLTLYSSDGNIVSGNNVVANECGAILLESSSNGNTISGNNIEDHAIYVDGNYNIISDNTISRSIIEGMWVKGSYNFISGNTIAYNGLYGNGGIYLPGSHNSIINNVILNNEDYGIDIYEAEGNLIASCQIEGNNGRGISIISGRNHIIRSCEFRDNTGYAIAIYGADSSYIYHNNFIGNNGATSEYDTAHIQAYDGSDESMGYHNFWNEVYPVGGNYWSDYPGVDNFSGPDQDIPGSDGIGDTPYQLLPLDLGNKDIYPLMSPWTPLCGDCNGDGVINSADVVYLINYLFKDGPAPVPLEAGDCNADGVINSADVVYLINYLFKGGPGPGLNCCPED